MSDQIRSMMKERDKMKRKACKSKLDLDWSSYKQLRNSVTRQIELAKRDNDYFNNLLITQAQDASKPRSSIRKVIPKKNKVALQKSLQFCFFFFIKPLRAVWILLIVFTRSLRQWVFVLEAFFSH